MCFVAGQRLVLIVAADSAVGARKVGAALGTACAEPVLLSDLTAAARLTCDIV